MDPNQLNASNSYYVILRELFFRLVVSFQIQSSLSMEIIGFWLWIQGNGQAGFLLRIESFDDNHFHVLASTAKTFVEVLHFEFDDLDDRSAPKSQFQREAIEGISFYLNNVCYKALQVLRERAKMDFIHNQMTDLYQEAYGEFMNDRVPISSMTDLYKGAYGESLYDQVPLSSKHLLTRIKALYANTQKNHGEGTSSRQMHVQTSHMLLQDIKEEVYECQSPSRLVTLLDNLSLREKHHDAIMQQLSDVPRDERTLFVTFSNGYPLNKDELQDFFMRHYGDIEEISVEEPIEKRQPLYAHVTFYSQVTLFRVLDGNRRVKFMTRGKHLWARQFVPKKNKT
ncbi:uncharacterized protein LOC124690619 [Lolium rigidum]|uniref:uncharacterized protein LOC124690619 n=1 Tax=Lolium rigidum TaxID=89674 RepID=UPI001F5C3E27|nr:uncharacterized protein LOC124690619 [Lolium rigidum]